MRLGHLPGRQRAAPPILRRRRRQAGGGPGGQTGVRLAGERSRGLQLRQRWRRWSCASSGPPRRSPSSPTGGARWRGGALGSPPLAGDAGGSGSAGGRRSGCAPAPLGTPDCAPPESRGPGAPHLRRAGLLFLGSPPARHPWEPLVPKIIAVETLTGHPGA